MKKTILTSIIIAASMLAFPAMAQTSDAVTAKTEQTAKTKKSHRSDEKCKEQCQQHKMKKVSAFEGITLTEAQKESLKALRPERPQAGEKKDRQKADSVRNFPDRNKMRADYVNAVKGVLTPEQYVVFLENIVIRDAQIPGSGRMDRHHMRMGDKAKLHKEGKGPRRDGGRASKDKK